ncbi:MAG: hypothetical protein PHS37_06700 [Candidatus Omnitrophica bacterium]|nr:hypothetical protein [Candidatus Omnitrophota bacterium]
MAGKIVRGSAVFLSVLLLCASSHAAVKMNLDPPRVDLKVKPGEERGGYISVINGDEKEPMHVRAYVNDLVYLPDGSNDFLPPGRTPWTCGDWLKIGPTEFEVPAGKDGKLRYTVTVPKGVTGGRYGVIFFEMSPSYGDLKDSSGAMINIRMGTIMLIEIDGTQTYQAKLTAVDIRPVKSEKAAYEISCTVSNESNILVRPNGTAKIIGRDKKEIATVKINPGKTGVFPSTSRTFYAPYADKLAPGSYTLQVVLDYGGSAYIGGQKKFEVPK